MDEILEIQLNIIFDMVVKRITKEDVIKENEIWSKFYNIDDDVGRYMKEKYKYYEKLENKIFEFEDQINFIIFHYLIQIYFDVTKSDQEKIRKICWNRVIKK